MKIFDILIIFLLLSIVFTVISAVLIVIPTWIALYAIDYNLWLLLLLPLYFALLCAIGFVATPTEDKDDMKDDEECDEF